MAPRTGPRVKVISPNSGAVTTLSRSVSLASSAYSSAPASPTSSFQRRNVAGGQQQAHHRHEVGEETSDHRPFVTPHGAPPPPQSGRAVLHAIGINTYSAAAQRGKGGEAAPRRPAPSSPAPPSLSHRTATPQGRTFHGGSFTGNETQRSGLPNYFDEAAQQRATRAAPKRLAPTSFSSASRSVSRGLPTHEQRARSRAEDDEAIHRARAALEHAGDAVLRRPFSSLNSSSATHSKSALSTTTTTTSSGNRSNVSTSTLLGGNTSALPLRVSSVSPGSKHKGMRLPPSIPITRADISASDVDSEEEDGFDGNYRGGSRRRQRSWATEATENAAALVRRRTERTNEATSASSASFHHGDSGNTTQSFLAGRHVCPGMFAGVSAISLNPRLFDGMEHLGAAGSSSSAASPSFVGGKQGGGVGGRVQQRYCVRPLWSLVGTFKTALTGLVSVDLQQDCLRWLQRNPKGGQQCIKVPLSLILDVFTTKVVLEDENVEERQFTVVVRTSTRPSQVVFGFATASEANHMCAVLKRPSS